MHPSVRGTLDFDQPIALVLMAVLHFFPAQDNPASIISTLLAALPPGSYLVASHVTADYNDPTSAADGVQAVQRAGVPILTRTADEFADLALAGLELVPPGLVPVSEWRPDNEPGLLPQPAEVAYYGAVAVKPIPPISTNARA